MTYSVRITPPAGQGLLELAVAIAVLMAVLTALMAVGMVGDASLRTSAASRYAAFDCESRPHRCMSDLSSVRQIARAQVAGNPGEPVLARPVVTLPNHRGVHQLAGALKSESDIQLSVDLARVDGVEANLMQRLGAIFRDYGRKAGPGLFDLPTPDHFVRSSVSTRLWASRDSHVFSRWMPRIELNSRVALVNDSWAAGDVTEFQVRVTEGSSPSDVLRHTRSVMYLPAKEVLMPLLDQLGLESGTDSFRTAFDRIDVDTPLPSSRVRFNQESPNAP
jgi:hypothetical protein